MYARQFGVAIVGCGYIADAYAQDLTTYPQLALIGATDVDAARGEALAIRYGCNAYPSFQDLLADDKVDIVVNLTAHHAHYAITARCLAAGKHVYSEKPLAMTNAEAQALVARARQKKLRLSCAPFTFMGEAQQTVGKWLRERQMGAVRVVYAEVNAGRIESWHPAPQSFYQVGPLFDVGGYPLTIITAFLGAARRVSAFGRVLYPERVTQAGVPFPVQSPDFVVALVELCSGIVIRLTTSFYVSPNGKQSGIEFHGERGSLYLSSSRNFDARVEFAEYGQAYAPVPYVREPQTDVRWGRAIVDMADAIITGRPQRATGEQAAHVVEILCAAMESMQCNKPVEISSRFTLPVPMEWAA